jgi:multidrug efflux pump subunit AcrA (membrane-fusion protein)
VIEAVEHGQQVRAGEPLVKLDMKKIDDALRDAEAAKSLADLAAKQAAEDLRIARQATPIELAKSARAAEIAKEDLKRFQEIDRPTSEKSAEISFKLSAQNLEYQSEELRQLEKMYKADEVTEETEEIILKRARNDVEQAKWRHEMARIQREETLKISLPRKQEDAERAALTTAIDWDKAKVSLPIALGQKELAAAKAFQDAQKAGETLEKLRHDRAAMQIAAPISGTVYYGRTTRGKWTGGAEAAAMLRRGGKLAVNDVFMTVVGADGLLVRASISEKLVPSLQPGQAARISATALPDAPIAATLASVSSIPVAIGGLEGFATFKLAGAPPGIVAGMTCKVTIVAVNQPNVLAVPSSAVQTDDADAAKRYVLVAGADGKPQRRDVKLGKRTDAKVEIAEGLKEGETVLIKKPE